MSCSIDLVLFWGLLVASLLLCCWESKEGGDTECYRQVVKEQSIHFGLNFSRIHANPEEM